MHSHDAILLLRHSFSIPKILYTLRMAPCLLSSQIVAYDDLLRSILGDITNVHRRDNTVWHQASLPISAGGIGVQRAAQLAPSAFLASAAGCSDLVHQILPLWLQDVLDSTVEQALAIWQQDLEELPPSGTSACRQKAWDALQIQASYDVLLDAAPNESTHACLLAVATKESGAWLDALPVSFLGLRMDDNVIQIAVGLCLGLPLCEPHCCQHCGTEVDSMGTIGLNCHYSRGCHPRHAEINGIIQRSPGSAKIPRYLEPKGLYRSDGKRLDGALIHCALDGGQSADMGCHLPGHPGPLLYTVRSCCQRSGGQ